MFIISSAKPDRESLFRLETFEPGAFGQDQSYCTSFSVRVSHCPVKFDLDSD
jgi:hypothetical protein